ncbi:MAG: hypothetical protein EXX96DRAFT_576626 [Benjaminiella poitrasii]|nr:MAG: hypothetical protein EXX96DRAFT_576626 [Benjaminiella poitrasii]
MQKIQSSIKEHLIIVRMYPHSFIVTFPFFSYSSMYRSKPTSPPFFFAYTTSNYRIKKGMSFLKPSFNLLTKQLKTKWLPGRTVSNHTLPHIPSRNYAVIPPRYPPPTPYRNMPLKDQYVRFANNNRAPNYKSKRLWLFVGTGTVLFGGYYVTHLEKVPISGRLRFMAVTPRQEEGKKKKSLNSITQHELLNINH